MHQQQMKTIHYKTADEVVIQSISCRWRSGTQSILAKITTPIARAFNPTVESLNNSDVEV